MNFLRGSGNQRKCHFWTWTMHLQVECEFRFFYHKNNNYYYYSQTLLVGGHTNCHTQRNAFIRWSVGSSLVVSKSAPPSSCPVQSIHHPFPYLFVYFYGDVENKSAIEKTGQLFTSQFAHIRGRRRKTGATTGWNL